MKGPGKVVRRRRGENAVGGLADPGEQGAGIRLFRRQSRFRASESTAESWVGGDAVVGYRIWMGVRPPESGLLVQRLLSLVLKREDSAQGWKKPTPNHTPVAKPPNNFRPRITAKSYSGRFR